MRTPAAPAPFFRTVRLSKALVPGADRQFRLPVEVLVQLNRSRYQGASVTSNTARPLG
jgi:hypothetical protein